MALVFVGGLGETSDEALLKIFTVACGEGRVVKWHRARDSAGRRQQFGFLDLTNPVNAGMLVRIAPDVGLAVVPDSVVSPICVHASKAVSDDAAAAIREQVRGILAQNPGRDKEEEAEVYRFSEEARVQEALRLEPRAENMSDVVWEQVKRFRTAQARNEVLDDAARRARLEAFISSKRGPTQSPAELSPKRSTTDASQGQTERTAQHGPVAHATSAGSRSSDLRSNKSPHPAPSNGRAPRASPEAGAATFPHAPNSSVRAPEAGQNDRKLSTAEVPAHVRAISVEAANASFTGKPGQDQVPDRGQAVSHHGTAGSGQPPLLATSVGLGPAEGSSHLASERVQETASTPTTLPHVQRVAAAENALPATVSRLVVEHLGETNEALVDHICSLVRSDCAASKLADELKEIFDEEAESFAEQVLRETSAQAK